MNPTPSPDPTDPTDTSDPSRAAEQHGRLLVALQFGLLVLMAARAWVAPGPLAGLTMLLLGLAVLVAAAALAVNRPGNFNIRPTPRANGQLVTTGPYRWVRHPMYTAVLLAAAALAWQAGGWLDAALWLALLAVLLAKATLEERALLERYPAYAAYRERTRRLLPWGM